MGSIDLKYKKFYRAEHVVCFSSFVSDVVLAVEVVLFCK